jgi:hypothetical protein
MADLAQLHSAMLAAQTEREVWIKVQGEGARDWTPMDDRENAAVRAYASGKPTWAQIVARQDAQGWKLSDLKLAIDLAKREG